ncbi:hypothetical protein [Frateuria defendens]|uniref:hypothetical protein n=1 Tax=Frateuria defendens TaxID=2219559 RepID=UPI00066FBC09|nr:hypothetical protein [Frateuria defendens]
MSLAEFQRALGDLIASPVRCAKVRRLPGLALAGYALTARARERLLGMAGDPRMAMNCTLYRVNRLIPLHAVLPRSCRLLGSRLGGVLDAYFAGERDGTLQFGMEASRFAQWLAARHDTTPALRDLLAFELACHAVISAAGEPERGDDPRRRTLALRHDIGALLAAAEGEEPPPLPAPVLLELDARGDALVLTLVEPANA